MITLGSSCTSKMNGTRNTISNIILNNDGNVNYIGGFVVGTNAVFNNRNQFNVGPIANSIISGGLLVNAGQMNSNATLYMFCFKRY